MCFKTGRSKGATTCLEDGMLSTVYMLLVMSILRSRESHGRS